MESMSTKTLIIGFGHKAQQGKDAVVEHLISTYEDRYDIRRYAFADQVKVEVYDALNNWRDPFWNLPVPFNFLTMPHPKGSAASPEEKVSWVNERKADTDVRRLLQNWATEYRRNTDPLSSFYWVNALRSRIEGDKAQVALISDMRFANEFHYVNAFGGYTVKISRLGYINPDPVAAAHISENQLNNAKFDFEIQVPDGDSEQVNELKKDAVFVFEEILRAYQGETSMEVDVAVAVQ